MFFTSLAIWPLKKLGKRVIVQTDTFPGINWFPKSKIVEIVMRIYARVIGNPILRAADKVVLLHEGLTDVAQKLKLKYEVIHNGIDIEAFDIIPPPPDLKKKNDEIWIGYVGRLESVKGWNDLADVALKMVPTDKRLHFFFIGPTKNAEETISHYQHPQIHFLGLRPDVAGIDKSLDIFVMPSYSEGLSNAIMEAMTAKCALLVTNVGGNKVLIEDGQEGLLYTPKDQEELQSQLQILIHSPSTRESMGKKSRKKIEDGFSLQKNVQRLSDLLTG
jgi:glycosyltransferase involved in cell wall biosynthesis